MYNSQYFPVWLSFDPHLTYSIFAKVYTIFKTIIINNYQANNINL